MAESEGGDSKFMTGFLFGFLLGVLVALGVGGSFVLIRGRGEMARARAAMAEAEMARAMADEARAEQAKLEAEKKRGAKEHGGGDPKVETLPQPDVEAAEAGAKDDEKKDE